MAKYNKPIQKITLILEFFAFGITVSIFLCYLFVTTNILDNPFQMLFAAALSAGSVLVISCIIRYFRLARVFSILNSEREHSVEELQYCKKRLLLQPRFEAISMFFRYTIGISGFVFILYNNHYLTDQILREIIVGFLVVVPITCSFFMFQSEQSIMKYLKDSRLLNIHLPLKIFKSYGVTMKLMFLLGSILIVPVVILSEFLFLLKSNQMVFLGKDYLLFTLLILVIFAAFFTCFLFIKQLKASIKDIGFILTQMSTGFISLPLVPMLSRDEISKMSNDINEILKVLSDVIRETKISSLELAQSATEISDSAIRLSENAQKQAATVEEITATIEQLTASGDNSFNSILTQNKRITELVDLLDESNRIVRSSDNIMKNALGVKDNLDQSVTSTKKMIEETVAKMNMVRKGSDQILNSTNIIQDISDKINLLSLNASIEAARAGDAGKGFAVVAGEIGKLADETVNNVKIITEMISQTHREIGVAGTSLKGVLDETKNSSDYIYQFGNAVVEVSKNSQQDLEINDLIQTNADSVMKEADNVKIMLEEQKNSLKEVSNSVNDINLMLQTTAASAEEFVANADVLTHMARKLKEKIDFFQ